MYENGIDVVYELHHYRRQGQPRVWSEHRKLTLPGWCAGDVQMAVALHAYGQRDSVEDVRIVDWQPHVDTIEDSMQEFLVDDEPEGGVVVFEPGTVWMDPETGEFGRFTKAGR
jgi:hypothetical protein